MTYFLHLKRPFIWIKRFRKRCGYGVHSPFAFDFITNVIYEKTAYYAYEQIKHTVEFAHSTHESTEKLNRLLFRLVNRVQPYILVTTSTSSSALYLQAAKKNREYITLDAAESVNREYTAIDFLYVDTYKNPVYVEKLMKEYLPYVQGKSVFVIKGIHSSKAMKQCWKRLIEDDRVGITFDLYEVGILFFDKTKLKQHYIVNF